MKDTFEELIQTIERGGNDNVTIIPNVKQFAKSWRAERKIDSDTQGVDNEAKELILSGMNHNRSLESFSEDLQTIRKAGFNPIAVSQILFEDTFVFRTKSEATRAFKLLEKQEGKVVGWWYGAADFMETLAEYESDINCKVLVHYLIKKKE